MDNEFIKATRETPHTWRFDQAEKAPSFFVGVAYIEVDNLMAKEGYSPSSTRFQTNPDKTFTLWETYRK